MLYAICFLAACICSVLLIVLKFMVKKQKSKKSLEDMSKINSSAVEQPVEIGRNGRPPRVKSEPEVIKRKVGRSPKKVAVITVEKTSTSPVDMVLTSQDDIKQTVGNCIVPVINSTARVGCPAISFNKFSRPVFNGIVRSDSKDMLSKKIFYQKELLLCEINTKKFLNENLYEKFIVRSKLLGSEAINKLDTNTKTYNIRKTNLSRLISSKTSELEGYSLNARKTVYTNRRNNLLRFESFACNFSSSSAQLDNVYKSLKSSQLENKKINNSLMILKPIKGGFSSYCSGVLGFIPRTHGFMIMRKIPFILANRQIENKENTIKFFVSPEKFSSRYFTPRMNFELGQAALYPKFEKYNFSSSNRKKNRFSTKYNFVFLSKKADKSLSIQRKKTEKKKYSHKHYNSKNAKIKKVNRK